MQKGFLIQKAPHDVSLAEVWIGEAEPYYYRFHVGHMNPIEDIEGIYGRLTNLGYASALGEDEADRSGLANAVRAFQKDNEMEITGEIDDATRSKLKESYGS